MLTCESLRGRSGLSAASAWSFDAADDRDVAAFRILEAEAVVAVRLTQGGGRFDGLEAKRRHLRMQGVDGRAIGGVEHHANEAGFRRAADRDDMMESAGAAQVMHAVVFRHRRQIPHRGKEAQRLAGVGESKIDAAQRTHLGLAHAASPRKRAALS